jgi:hypothetical protein
VSVWGTFQALADARRQGDRERVRALQELARVEVDFARATHRRRQFPAPRRVLLGFVEANERRI